MTQEEVAVVGAGVKVPGGGTVDKFWSGLLDGRSAIAPYQHPELPEKVTVSAAKVADGDINGYVSAAEARRLDRIHLLAIGAATDALAGRADRAAPDRCAVVCGAGYGAADTMERAYRTVAADGLRGLSPLVVPLSMVSSTAAHLALRFGFEGPCLTVSTACASGADAIGHGVELIRRGDADLVLAGGVDAMISVTTVLGFFRLGALTANPDAATACRPFDRDRDGFVLGEGAGFVLLQRLAEAKRQRADVLGLVSGYSATCDSHHIVAPRGDGAAARRCAEQALANAGITPAEIGHINAHGTSTPRNDLAEGNAMIGLFDGKLPPVTAVKGMTGHMIGGSGAVEAIVAMLSLCYGLVPPVAGYQTPDPEIALDIVAERPRPISARYAISNSFGFGGHNAVLVLASP